KDVGLELRIPVFHASFDRYPNPSYEYLATESFDKVNGSGPVIPTGSVGFSLPLPRGFGFGVGIFTPPGTPSLKFGNTAINTINVDPNTETLPGTSGVRETPGRYLLIEKEVLAAFLMAGVGYSPIPQLRVGVSVGGGFVDVAFKNVSSVVGGALNDAEVLSDVKVLDAFVPRTTFSVAATPIDSIDLLATFTYTGDISAKGDLEVTGNGITSGPVGDCASPTPGPRCKVKDVTLKIPYQRFEVLLGGRYAQRRNKRERVLDPIKDEVWDVELNAYWSQTSHVDNYTLHIRDANQQRQVSLASDPAIATAPLPENARLFHGWKDTYGVRVGGDYNVLADFLALRAGLGFETRGVPKANMNLDYWPVQRTTLSLGATVKLGRWKIHAAYAHVFNQTVDVKVGEGNVREVASINGAASQVINEGKYSSRLDVFSLQGNVQF
ncbi:MAG TPA: outer membrane protein transport protein, partial [Polyangiales bacterium]|nr:outer membrane protein transport protein [Polyangiales bacterium]